MKTLLQDLRYAVRQLRKAPGFSLTAILTLALGVGVAAAVFSVIDAVLVRPLPYNNPDKIVGIQPYSPQGYTQPASYPQYLQWRRENHSFSALAGYSRGSVNFLGPQGPAPIHAVSATDNFFDVFGVNPILGRTFAAGEDEPGRNNVVVLSYEIWKQNFGARKDVLGATVNIDGEVDTIIGVMPAGFRFPINQVNAIYRPLHTPKELRESKGSHWLPTIARLKPGASLEQASQDMAQVLQSWAVAYPDDKGKRMVLRPIQDVIIGDTKEPLRALFFAVMGVLAIGCVNVAGLLLARGVKRERELAVRSAIGATRNRLIRQLLTESVLLSIIGSIGGALLAQGLLITIKKLIISSLNRGADVHLNIPVLLASLAVAVLTGVLSGSLPAFQLSRISPNQVMRSGGSAGSSRRQNYLRGGFIVAQVSLTLVLLVCSGLLLQTLHNLRNTKLGFDPSHILSEEISLTPSAYQGKDVYSAYYRPLLEKVQSIPGVDAAGVIQLLPIQGWGWNSDIQIVGHPPAPRNTEQLAEVRSVTPGYHKAFGIQLVKGRMLDESLDTPKSQQVCVVNEAFVKKFLSPGEQPLGAQIEFGDKVTIVGVTKNIRQDLTQEPLAEIDFPVSQLSQNQTYEALSNMTLVVHSKIDPNAIATPLKSAMTSVDPTIPFRPMATMTEVVSESLIFQRLESWLFGIFGGLALLLSVVGIYGLISHEVELRTRDIGIRMAIGSTRQRILLQIMSSVALLMGIGVSIGWVITLIIKKGLAAVVTLNIAHDALLLGAITVSLVGIGLLSSLFPAKRAASIEPMQALRLD